MISDFCKSGVMSVDDTIRGPGMAALWDLHRFFFFFFFFGWSYWCVIHYKLFLF